MTLGLGEQAVDGRQKGALRIGGDRKAANPAFELLPGGWQRISARRHFGRHARQETVLDMAAWPHRRPSVTSKTDTCLLITRHPLSLSVSLPFIGRPLPGCLVWRHYRAGSGFLSAFQRRRRPPPAGLGRPPGFSMCSTRVLCHGRGELRALGVDVVRRGRARCPDNHRLPEGVGQRGLPGVVRDLHGVDRRLARKRES